MSHVCLLTADRPLPLRSAEKDGFDIQESLYYREAVEDLDLLMKAFLYELDLEATEQAARGLRTYLESVCRPGEQVELWNLWVGGERSDPVHRFSGRLEDLDRAALEQLQESDQTCMTVKK